MTPEQFEQFIQELHRLRDQWASHYTYTDNGDYGMGYDTASHGAAESLEEVMEKFGVLKDG